MIILRNSIILKTLKILKKELSVVLNTMPIILVDDLDAIEYPFVISTMESLFLDIGILLFWFCLHCGLHL